MIPPLFEHQKKVIDDNKLWTGIFTGTGSMKTRTSLELAQGKTLIICEKQGRDDRTFQDNAKKFGINKNITVISKEDFRRDAEILSYFDTVIVDECHNFLGVYPETRQKNHVPIPKTSQLFEKLLWYVQTKKPERFYLLSATPSSKPMHVYAAGVLLGKDWDFFTFRETFYIQRKMGPYRSIWLPKKDKVLKERLALALQKLGYTGALIDFMDVPEQTKLVKYFGLTPAQKDVIKLLKASEADPMAIRTATRTIENGVLYGADIEAVDDITDKIVRKTTHFSSEKIDYIVEKASEFKKMLIFATYTGQIHAIADSLMKEGYKPTIITGKLTDRSTVFKEADASNESILIVQSSISAGYELPSFPVVIYASYSNRVLHKIQGDGRVLRGNALKKNLYVSLVIKGGLDEQCYKTIESGVDFNELVNTK